MRRLILLSMMLPGISAADLSVATGPTSIPRGDATSASDITVNNGKFAVSFAVETAAPWGVARGGIVDIAIVREGVIGYDIASLADFMPNKWSAWPTSYQRISISERSPEQVTIKTERDWGAVQLETVFRIRDNDSRIHIVTTMENKGEQELVDLQTGYVVWPDGGYLFSVPGLTGLTESEEGGALADWSASYDENWVLGLHAPYAELVSYSGRDRYLPHSLGSGEKKSFEATLQIVERGDLSPLVDEDIRMNSLAAGRLHGVVTDSNGAAVATPAVVIEQGGKPYAWTIGDDGAYSMRLPEGQYSVYATANSYSQSARKELSVLPGEDHAVDFEGLQPPGRLAVTVVDKDDSEPIDARISVQSGPRSLIEYFGKSTFFTELDTRGKAELRVAPGNYRLQVSAGSGFTSMPQSYDIEVSPGSITGLDAAVAVTTHPQRLGWYSADLHHHSDVLDGFTEPRFVLRSELASGVDLAFLSDHDSVVNNAELARLSKGQGIEFIPGTELSPSWAHFNAYPIDSGKDIEIEVGASTVQKIFTEARRLGADIVHVNHPYGDYGYFRSLNLTVEVDGRMESAVPGGYDDTFDIVEVTANDFSKPSGEHSQTIVHAWKLWNEGKRAYIAGGSDVHDVWNEISGISRTYVHVEGEPTADSFVAALKRGNAFASQGPLVFPEVMFGSELSVRPGEDIVLAYNAQAAAGLRAVQLIERGEIRQRIELDTGTELTPVAFTMSTAEDTWYSVVVEDQRGKFAWSNPLWVKAER